MNLITPESLVRYLKPWGATYRQAFAYADCHQCPKCEQLQKLESNMSWCSAVIGFSKTQPRTSESGIGILILECPHCHAKFWAHLEPAGIWNCMVFCPKWPDAMKHPDARKK